MSRWLTSAFPFVAALVSCAPDDGRPSGPINLVFDAGTDGDAAPDAAITKKGLAADCTGDSECESGHCFRGGKSSYCSLACNAQNAASVCLAPAFDATCNNQGFCRKPG